MSEIHINDRISMDNDSIAFSSPARSKGLWAKTEVLVGHDIKHNKRGKSTLGEVLFTGHNTVTVGGVQYVMEKLFNVSGPLTVSTLYSDHAIGKADSSSPTDTFDFPDESDGKKIIYRSGNHVCLFAVGITGNAENDVTVYPVDYREHDIDMNVVNSDGVTLEGVMLPFRYTIDTLSDTDKVKYFGKKTDTDTGYTAYYLKTFDTTPTIKHVYVTGEDSDEDSETEATDSDVWTNKFGDNAIETFTESIFTISTKDIKEYYSYIEQEDRARITTIALYSGEYIVESSDTDMGDFRDCRMFSKINIPTENLSLSKDLNIIYRVYGH